MKIEFPDVFRPLVAPARYKGAWGGRGSGKSHFFGGLLCLRALRQRTRAVCLREVQNSIKDSVKQLLEDKIDAYGLSGYFEITDSQIRGPNDSLFVFRGLKNHNAASIKSLEGFDIAWVEEAQTVSQKSLDLLIPTIRTRAANFGFPGIPSARPIRSTGCCARRNLPRQLSFAPIIRTIRFFPEVLRADMERDRRSDPAKFDHVWLGGYQDAADMQFIARETIRAAQERRSEPAEEPRIMGLDVARFGDDRTALILRKGHRVCRIRQWSGLDLMQTAGRVSEIAALEKPHALFVDGVGVGGGVVDRLRQLGLKVIDVNGGARAGNAARYRNKRAEMWARMRDWLRDVGEIPDDDELAIDLQTPNYSFDVQNRIQIEKKEQMKKRGLLSPDLADALALTFAEAVHHKNMNAAAPKLPGAQYNPLEGW